MCRSEYTANIEGFTSYGVSRKPVAKKAGLNLFKVFGYVLTTVVIVAALF